MFEFIKKKKSLVTPAVSVIGSMFGNVFFNRKTDFANKYREWVNLVIRIKAQECASTPLRVYTKNKDGEKEEVKKGALYDLVKTPDNGITTRDLIEGISSFLDIDGNAYIYKARVGSKIVALWLLRSDWVTIIPSKDKSKLIERYEYKTGKKKTPLDVKNVIHLKEFNPKFYNEQEPYKGMGIIEAAMSTISEDENIKKWNNKFFDNGAVPEGVLEYEGALSEADRIRLEKKWKQKQAGMQNAHKIPFLQGGLKYKKTGLSQNELSFIEQRKLDRDDIFAMFGIPKGLLLSDNVNLANAKMALWSFARFTVKPRLKKIEEALNINLVNEVEEGNVLEFDNPVPEDKEAKINEYDKGCNKWLTVNDIRNEEGREPLEGGDVLLNLEAVKLQNQLENQKEISQDLRKKLAKKSIAVANEKRTNDRMKRGEKAWKAMIDVQSSWEDTYRLAMKKYFFELRYRVLKKVREEKKSLIAKKGYVNKAEEENLIFDILDPIQREYYDQEGSRAMRELGIDMEFDFSDKVEEELKKYDLKLAGTISETTINDIEKLVKDNESEGIDVLTEKISKYFDKAEEYRAERIARSETIRTANASAVVAWKQSGVVEGKEWFTAKDDRVCEYCASMDGKRIELDDTFAEKGTKVLDMEMNYRSITEPPLHSQCRCILLPIIK